MSDDFDFTAFIDSQKTQDLDALAKNFEQAAGSNTTREVDIRFWDPKTCVDADGNGRAVIRLLPAPDTPDSPFVGLIKHSWKNSVNGQPRYYIENSRKSIGLADPVYDYNGSMFDKYGKEEAKKHLIPRSKRYIANIVVMENDVTPDQVGKIFLWDFGGQIYEKIDAKMFPKHVKDKRVNPFNIFEGMSLIVRVYQKKVGDGSLPQYDSSEWEAPSPMGKDPTKTLKGMFKSMFSLKEFIDPSKFKSYEDLQKQLDYVTGKSDTPANGGGTGSSEAKQTKTAEAKKPVEDSIPFDVDTPEPAKAETQPKAAETAKDDDDFFARFRT